MTIVQKPDPLNLSGNLSDFVFFTDEAIAFSLFWQGRELYSGVYTPGNDHKISVSVKEVIESVLEFQFRDILEVYSQDLLVDNFQAFVDGRQIADFKVIKGGVATFGMTAKTFLQQHFLTWQPREKKISYSSPEFLTYYAVEDSKVKIKAYFNDASGSLANKEIVMASLSAGKAYTIPVMYAVVVGKMGSYPAFYDVWIESTDGSVRYSYVQRYVYDMARSEQEEYVIFENSLGGIDAFRAYGNTEYQADNTHNIAVLGDELSAYRIDIENKYTKNTGYLDEYELKWIRDFFPALKKYIFRNNILREIVLTEDNVTASQQEQMGSYEFTYRYSDDSIYLNLPILSSNQYALSKPINVAFDSIKESIKLEPRLAEFPMHCLSEGTLIPVQEPFSESWKITNAGAIVNYTIQKINEMTNGDLLYNRFKGYYITESALKKAYPNPITGESAWVGEPFPGVVYVVGEDGWETTGEAPKYNDSVNLNDYVLNSVFSQVVNDLEEEIKGLDIYDVSEAVKLAEAAAAEALKYAELAGQSGELAKYAKEQGDYAKEQGDLALQAKEQVVNDVLFKTPQNLSEEEQAQVKRNIGLQNAIAGLITLPIVEFSAKVNATTATKTVDNIIPKGISFLIVDIGVVEGDSSIPASPELSAVLCPVSGGGRIVFQGTASTKFENFKISVISGSAEKDGMGVEVSTPRSITYKVFQVRYLTEQGSGTFKGSFNSLQILQSAYPTAKPGDYAYVGNPRHLYEWDSLAWQDRGLYITDVDQALDIDSGKAIANKAVAVKLSELDKSRSIFSKSYATQVNSTFDYRFGYYIVDVENERVLDVSTPEDKLKYHYVLVPVQDGKEFFVKNNRGDSHNHFLDENLKATRKNIFCKKGITKLIPQTGDKYFLFQTKFNDDGNENEQDIYTEPKGLENVYEAINAPFEYTYNLFDADDVQKDMYVDNDGVISIGEGWTCSGYIPVKPDTDYFLSGKPSRLNGLVWLDGYKKKISNDSSVIYNRVIHSPSNAAFLVFNVESTNGGFSEIQLVEGSSSKPYLPNKYIKDIYLPDVQEIKKDIDTLEVSVDENTNITEEFVKQRITGANLIDSSKFTDGYYINSKGDPTALDTYSYTGKIDIMPDTHYCIYAPLGTSGDNNNTARFVNFYDEGGNHLNGTQLESIKTFTSPFNAHKCVLSLLRKQPGVPDAPLWDMSLSGLFLGKNATFEKYFEKEIINLKDKTSFLSKNTEALVTKKDLLESMESVLGDEFIIELKSDKTLSYKFGNNSMDATLNRYYTQENPNYSGNPMFNFIRFNNQNLMFGMGDDAAPFHAQNTTLGANHAQPCVIATIEGHGKDNTAIGTEWSSSDGTKFYIMRIVDENKILFLSENKGTPESQSFTPLKIGILTGTEGGELNVSSVSSSQLYPSVFDVEQKLYNNGIEVSETKLYKSSVFDVVESYSVVNTDEILKNIIARKGQDKPAEFKSSTMVRVENIYRFLPNMAVLVIANFVTKQQIKFQDVMFAQAGLIGALKDGKVKHYVPNSLEINGYNLNKPVQVPWSTDLPQFFFTETYWADKEKPVDRVIQINGDCGLALGFLPYGVGKDLKKYTSFTFEIRNDTGKVYPHGVDYNKQGATLPPESVYSAVLYRCFFRYNEVDGRIGMYYLGFDNKYFVFADYAKQMNDHLVISEKLNGKRISVINSNNVELKTDIYNDGLYLSASYTEGESSFIVLLVE